MVWQGIDYGRALREFADKVVEVHAKDGLVKQPQLRPPETRCMHPLPFRDENYETGIVRDDHPVKGWGAGLYNHAVPGLGDVEWGVVTRAMRESGLGKVPLVVEIEDEAFNPRSPKPGENYCRAAFAVAARTLEPYCLGIL